MSDWIDPTEQEVKALHDKLDYPIVGIIKALDKEEIKLIASSLIFKKEFRDEYMGRQNQWINDFKWFWGINHPKEAYESSGNDDLLNSHELERYRLYYAAKYPEKMEITHINRRTLDFLRETEDAIKIVRSYLTNSNN